MLAIRLQRNGRTHFPVYRIVVQEAQRHPLSGRVVAEVGHTKATTLDKEKINQYLSNGAQPSTRVVRILTSNGLKMPKWVKLPTKKQAAPKHADKLRKNQPQAASSVEETSPASAEAAEA